MRRLEASMRILWHRGGRMHVIGFGAAWAAGLLFGLLLTKHFQGAAMLGAMTALFYNGMYTLIGGALVWVQLLRELIQLGTRRRTAVLACTLTTLGISLVLHLICGLLYAILAGGAREVVPFAFWLGIGGLMLVLWMLSALASVVIHRFAMTGLSVMYFVFAGIVMSGRTLAAPLLVLALANPVLFSAAITALFAAGTAFSLYRLTKISA